MFLVENTHSTDVESLPPPPRVCMSIHPEGLLCGHVRYRFECLFSTTLAQGPEALGGGAEASQAGGPRAAGVHQPRVRRPAGDARRVRHGARGLQPRRSVRGAGRRRTGETPDCLLEAYPQCLVFPPPPDCLLVVYLPMPVYQTRYHPRQYSHFTQPDGTQCGCFTEDLYLIPGLTRGRRAARAWRGAPSKWETSARGGSLRWTAAAHSCAASARRSWRASTSPRTPHSCTRRAGSSRRRPASTSAPKTSTSPSPLWPRQEGY